MPNITVISKRRAEQIAKSYIKYKFSRKSKSPRRYKLDKEAKKNITGKILLELLNKQNWNSATEKYIKFFISPSHPNRRSHKSTALIYHNNKYCLIDLNYLLKYKKYQLPSIDRIDSSIGYEISNIQLTSKKYNLAKGNMNDAEFKLWLKSLKSL